MSEIKKVCEMAGCEGCPMRKLFPDSTFVAPKYGASLRLSVAEAPGETESITGIPLTGGAGRWFDSLCRKAGLHREQLNLTNIINCRPPDNVFPTDSAARSYISEKDADAAVKQCVGNYLLPLLEGRPWTRIDILGDKALEWLTGLKQGIMKWRGSPIEVDTDEIRKRIS